MEGWEKREKANINHKKAILIAKKTLRKYYQRCKREMFYNVRLFSSKFNRAEI